jgi:hypothetical protein
MKNKLFKSLLLAVAGVLGFTACSDDEPYINTTPIISSVVTTEAEVTAYSAVLKGTVDGLSGQASSAFKVGALYSDDEASVKTAGIDVSGTYDQGNISASVSGLTTNKVYYYCVYVTLQGRVSYYGDVKSFVTTDAKLNNCAVSNVTASSALITANVTGTDGVPVEIGAGAKISTSNVVEDVKNGLEVEGSLENGSLSVKADGLLPNTVYYYIPYISLGDGLVYGEPGSFRTSSFTPQYVDLGLSVLWATANVGAEKATDFGSRVGYGQLDVTMHSTDMDDYTVTKDIFGGANDIAAANDYGRMPLADEVKELIVCTTHEWVVVDGVQGIRFTAANGNSIFLPAAGSRSGQDVSDLAEVGNYWLGQIEGSNDNFGRTLQFSENSAGLSTLARNVAASIRPVKKQPVEFKKALLNQTWYIDLDADGKSYLWDGPIYFYGSDDSWTTVSNGDSVSGDSWCWAPTWGDISSWIGFNAQEFGSMTFTADGKVKVQNLATGKSYEGTYTVNEKDKTISLTNAEVLHVPGDYTGVTTNLRILSLTDKKMQIAIIRSDGQAVSQNYISGEQKEFYSKPVYSVEFCDSDGQNSWPKTTEQIAMAAGETHTIAINQGMVAGEVVIVDFIGLRKDYPHAFIRLDKVELDGKAVSFDGNKIRYGDLEGNGNYRIELFNRYGNTAKDSPFGGTNPDSEAALACKNKIELTYTIVNLKDNDENNGLVGELTLCSTSWETTWKDATAPIYFDGCVSDTQQSIKYSGSRPNGMIDLVELKNVMSKYPNMQLRLDEVLVDGKAVAFDAGKILYGDLEGKGNYRIELYNCYGSTATASPWAGTTDNTVPSLGFSSSFEVKYTVLKLF